MAAALAVGSPGPGMVPVRIRAPSGKTALIYTRAAPGTLVQDVSSTSAATNLPHAIATGPSGTSTVVPQIASVCTPEVSVPLPETEQLQSANADVEAQIACADGHAQQESAQSECDNGAFTNAILPPSMQLSQQLPHNFPHHGHFMQQLEQSQQAQMQAPAHIMEQGVIDPPVQGQQMGQVQHADPEMQAQYMQQLQQMQYAQMVQAYHMQQQQQYMQYMQHMQQLQMVQQSQPQPVDEQHHHWMQGMPAQADPMQMPGTFFQGMEPNFGNHVEQYGGMPVPQRSRQPETKNHALEALKEALDKAEIGMLSGGSGARQLAISPVAMCGRGYDLRDEMVSRSGGMGGSGTTNFALQAVSEALGTQAACRTSNSNFALGPPGYSFNHYTEMRSIQEPTFGSIQEPTFGMEGIALDSYKPPEPIDCVDLSTLCNQLPDMTSNNRFKAAVIEQQTVHSGGEVPPSGFGQTQNSKLTEESDDEDMKAQREMEGDEQISFPNLPPRPPRLETARPSPLGVSALVSHNRPMSEGPPRERAPPAVLTVLPPPKNPRNRLEVRGRQGFAKRDFLVDCIINDVSPQSPRKNSRKGPRAFSGPPPQMEARPRSMPYDADFILGRPSSGSSKQGTPKNVENRGSRGGTIPMTDDAFSTRRGPLCGTVVGAGNLPKTEKFRASSLPHLDGKLSRVPTHLLGAGHQASRSWRGKVSSVYS